MNQIFKYELENIDQQIIDVPLPARILSVVEQKNDIVLYAIIDDDKDVPTIPLDILIRGTGDAVENNIGLYTFLGTVKLFDGREIWHVFYMYADGDHVYRQSDRLGEPFIEEIDRKFSGKGGMLIV